jgi:hypothetical protein
LSDDSLTPIARATCRGDKSGLVEVVILAVSDVVLGVSLDISL